jgi:hypothetical protein
MRAPERDLSDVAGRKSSEKTGEDRRPGSADDHSVNYQAGRDLEVRNEKDVGS